METLILYCLGGWVVGAGIGTLAALVLCARMQTRAYEQESRELDQAFIAACARIKLERDSNARIRVDG